MDDGLIRDAYTKQKIKNKLCCELTGGHFGRFCLAKWRRISIGCIILRWIITAAKLYVFYFS